MGINAAGLELIKKWEGCRLTAYKCPAGVWTIGYGHTGTVDGVKLGAGMKISQQKAEALLAADVAEFYGYVCKKSYVPLTETMTENQRAALTSLGFNCGANALKSLCRERTVAEIADAILLYHKSNGKFSQGLMDRRRAERALYLSDSETAGLAALRKGDRGQLVRVLQKLLGGLAVDGAFGPATETAVLAFQRAHGLTEDGIVGKMTWEALLEE